MDTMILDKIQYDDTVTSNFKHKHRFVVQGCCEIGWQDSVVGGHTVLLAEKEALKRINAGGFISNPKTRIRIVKSK